MSKRTLQRILRACDFSWRRIRKKPRGDPDPDEYAQRKEGLEKLKEQADQELIDLYFFDESGFCLDLYIPQEKGETIQVESSRTKRLSILGFLSQKQGLVAYTTEGTVDSELVIACFDAFCTNLEKKTVVILDNSSFHTSVAISEKISEWQSKNLEIFYLPKYSPQLNLIEILWRFMKYNWIEWWAYKGWPYLVKYIENVICGYGTEYKINFG